MYMNVKEGGIGLIHFPSSYSFSFPSKCINAVVNDDMPHAFFVRLFCGISLMLLFPLLFVPSVPHSLALPPVYTYIVNTFRSVAKRDCDIDFSQCPLTRFSGFIRDINLGKLRIRHDLCHLRSVPRVVGFC